MNRSLTLYYQNVRSLNNKLHLLRSGAHQLTLLPDIIVLTETWLSPSTSNAELGLSRYQIYRCDRNGDSSTGTRGGGVLIALQKKIHASSLLVPINTESLFIKIQHRGAKFLLAAAYLPPDSPLAYYTRFLSALEDASASLPEHKVLVCGDFNLRNVVWGNDPLDRLFTAYLPPVLRECADHVFETFAMLGLSQLYPNHPSKGYTLDLLFASSDFVKNCDLDDPLVPCDSHHVAQYFEVSLNCSDCDNNPVHLTRDFYKCDFELLNNRLSDVDWESLFDNRDIDQSVDTFNTVIDDIIKATVPLSRDTPCHFPKWYNFELRSMIIEKKKLHIEYLSSRSLVNKIKFKKQRAKCLRLSRKLYSDFVEATECSMKRNLKYFWSFVKKTRSDTSIPSSMRLGDEEASDGGRIAQLFSTHFESVYRPSTYIPLPRINSGSSAASFQ